MSADRLRGLLSLAAIAASGVSPSLLACTLPSASADPCPDIQVVFARGTDDPPGLGPTGRAFVDAMRPLVGGKSLDVYPVAYPASLQWTDGAEDGIKDASAHVESM